MSSRHPRNGSAGHGPGAKWSRAHALRRCLLAANEGVPVGGRRPGAVRHPGTQSQCGGGPAFGGFQSGTGDLVVGGGYPDPMERGAFPPLGQVRPDPSGYSVASRPAEPNDVALVVDDEVEPRRERLVPSTCRARPASPPVPRRSSPCLVPPVCAWPRSGRRRPTDPQWRRTGHSPGKRAPTLRRMSSRVRMICSVSASGISSDSVRPAATHRATSAASKHSPPSRRDGV